MNSIRTWEELLASDLPLRGDEVSYKSMYKEFAIIGRPEDGLLRLDWGLIIVSVIHSVFDTQVMHEELMLVVMEAQLDLVHGNKPYVPVAHVVPHYRTADNLGLVGNHADVSVHSVLVPTDKLDQIEFSLIPEPLKAWERKALSGS
jgi:hypothetical protein